jgi:hypothetical protein
MKKRATIVSKLQDLLEQEVKDADLVSVNGGRITICGRGGDIRVIEGDGLFY